MLRAAGPGCAQDFGKPPFPEWKDSTVLRVLTDSPWSKSVNVRLEWIKREEQPVTYKDVPGADRSPNKGFGSPVGGIGVPRTRLPAEADLLIRWSSALPVRQAAALYRQREGKLSPARLNELIGVPATDYVLEIRGIPAEIAHSGAESIEAIARQSTELRTASGRVIKPSGAKVSMQGTSLTVFVHFPRTAPIGVEERDVEFLGGFQVFEFRMKFKLSPMMYLGRLEL
jgi:hypothetical protein